MHDNRHLPVERVAHDALDAFLNRLGPAGVFARYVASRVPHAGALACTIDGRVVGAVIGGAEHDLYQAHDYWLHTDFEDVARALVTALVAELGDGSRGGGLTLEAIPEYAAAVAASVAVAVATASVSAAPVPSRDRIYVASRRIAEAGSVRVERLDGPRLLELPIAPELGPVLGRLDDWTDESMLHGVLDGGVLVAVAEASVRDGRHAAIQQVFTAPTHRGRGLARAIVATVTNDLLAREHMPVYVVDENNTASVRLVESLGYELRETWTCFALGR